VAVVFFLSSVCMRLDRIPSAGSREATVVVVLVVAGNDDLSCVFFFLSLSLDGCNVRELRRLVRFSFFFFGMFSYCT
jgi:hypothetical protein